MTVDGWTTEDDALVRTLRFGDFGEAWGFMSRVALVAERMDHHPDWRNVWGRVEMRLTTHDADGGAGGLTDKDRRLAEAVNRILAERGGGRAEGAGGG